MLKLTALSDLIAIFDKRSWATIIVLSFLVAGLMEFILAEQGRVLMFVLTGCAISVQLFVLCFLAYAGWNSVVVARYGASDLFLSALVVFGLGCAASLALRSATETGFFSPVFLILGGIATLTFSGIFAIGLPLIGKVFAGLQS